MDKKILIIIGTLLVILALFLIYASVDYSNDANRTKFNVTAHGPLHLSEVADDIKTDEFYKGYDNETLAWMESLGDKYVFYSSDEIVIMSYDDANKIQTPYPVYMDYADVNFYEIFSANVLENHSLGGNNSKDVLLVEHVKYIGEDVYYWEV